MEGEMIMVQIRRALPEDYHSVDRLMGELHRQHVKGQGNIYRPCEHPYSEDEYEELLKNPKNMAFCAEEEGIVVGYASMVLKEVQAPQLISRKIAYVNELIVAPGKRHGGIGRKLMEAMESEAKEQGAVEMQLMVWEFNTGGLEFYQSLGMKTQRRILEKKL